MPRSIPVPIRQSILQRFQRGQRPAAIAEELEVSVRTVRHLLQRFAEENPVNPAYDRCGRPSPPPPSWLKEAHQMRQQHPGWGAGLIRLMLPKTNPCFAQGLPCERTIQRWLRRLEAPAAPPGRRPEALQDRAQKVHEVWQVDAADQMRLKSGAQASWLRVVDERSGAVLKTVVFSRGKLEASASGGNAAGAAGLVHSLGFAPASAGRQRRPLGIVERPATRSGVVADRAGSRPDLEPRRLPSGERGGRAFAGHRETLGRARGL